MKQNKTDPYGEVSRVSGRKTLLLQTSSSRRRKAQLAPFNRGGAATAQMRR